MCLCTGKQIDGFARVKRTWAARISGDVHLTNRTGYVLEMRLSPNFDGVGCKVCKAVIGHEMTAQLLTLGPKAYLTIIGYSPEGRMFHLVQNATVYRRHEYVFESKHFNAALNQLCTQK